MNKILNNLNQKVQEITLNCEVLIAFSNHPNMPKSLSILLNKTAIEMITISDDIVQDVDDLLSKDHGINKKELN